MGKKRVRVRVASAWADARALVGEHRRRLALGLGLLLVNRMAALVLPTTSKFLIDDVVGEGRSDLLWPLALAAGVATLIQAATAFSVGQVLGVAAQGAINEIRKRLQDHASRLPVAFFDRSQSGALISRIMSDPEGVRNLVGTGFVQLVGGSITALVGLIVLFWLQWRLTAVILVVLLLFGGCMVIAFRRLRPIFRERGEVLAQISGRLGQSLGGIRVVKAYVAEDHEHRVFSDGVDRLFANVRRSITSVSILASISLVVVGTIGALMITIGGRTILDGQMSVGEFVMYLVYVAVVVGPVVQIASIGTQVSEAFGGLDRIRELQAEVAEDEGDEEREALTDLHGDVSFEGVGFEYEPGRPVLHDVSFEAPAGTTTALIGSSGSGKSTLTGLVMAFHRPTTGTVRVDGHDLTRVRLASYRIHLGVVMQDSFLFDGTVAENILFSRPRASKDEMRQAARVAHCDEFVERFEMGYDTVVGERGVRLSGGQRQRIAIARAMLANPRILILDEATSSLDSESESLIRDGLQTLRKRRTTFVIAHRLSTIRSADQILVLEGGRIVERGTHAELYAARGRYRDLHDHQVHVQEERFLNPGEESSGPD